MVSEGPGRLQDATQATANFSKFKVQHSRGCSLTQDIYKIRNLSVSAQQLYLGLL